MSWEDRFSSIVRETESNLARVRQRLSSAHSLSRNIAILHAPSPLETSNILTKSYPNGLNNHNTLLNGSTPLLTSPYTKPNLYKDGFNRDVTADTLQLENNHHVPVEQSPAVITLLNDKVEAQNRELASLKKTVRKLEKERDQYHKDIMEMKGDLNSVRDRLAEKGVDLQTERKMEEWKRNMIGEVHDLQTELQRYKGREEDRQYGESQIGALSREINELRLFTRDECEAIRRDIETTKTRIVRLELELASAVTDNKELTRRHDRMDRTFRDVSDTQMNHSKDFNKTLEDRDFERLQLHELRETMIALRDKLDGMESTVNNASTVRFGDSVKATSTGILSKPKQSPLDHSPPTKPKIEFDLDDLTLSDSTDLADYDSSDFSFTPKARRKGSDLVFDEDLYSLNLSDDETETLTNYDISLSDLKR
ncbi:myosin-2 heavy chain, non muscle-like [Lineus longissimus]|uniref:myosin-2 heavy chain, non muscle-like n=1 Tax=Lineus longissimus TaxID=88925 RepID=UPI002B4CFEBC